MWNNWPLPFLKRVPFLHKDTPWEDIFVFFLLCPALFLYVVFERFPLLYAVPLGYSALRLLLGRAWEGGGSYRPAPELLRLLLLLGILGVAALFHRDLFFLFPAFVRDSLIFASFLVPFLFPHRFESRHIKALFGVEAVAYLLWIDASRWNRFFIDLFASRSFSEYDMGLFFGLFFLWFLYRKDWAGTGIALFILILVSKRAVYLGLVLPVIWWLFSGRVEALRRPEVRQRVLLSLYALLLVFSFFVVDSLTAFVHGFLQRGDIQIDHLLNGRAFVLDFTTFSYAHSDWFSQLFGRGAGQLDASISLYRPVFWAKYYPEPSNPHNDFLKILFDYGAVGTLGFAVFMTRWFSRTRIGTLLFLYSLVLYFFDNSLIHLYYNLIAMIICQSESHEEAIDKP
jgi:hypothetical protein